MRWDRAAAEFLRSDCGRYTISKTGPWGGVRYIAWHKTAGQSAERLGSFDCPERAQAAAKKHAKGGQL